jgi:hypothetical protein
MYLLEVGKLMLIWEFFYGILKSSKISWGIS